MKRKTLHWIGKKEGTDKARRHQYTRMYPNYMECYRDSPIKLLEIGIKVGASLRMWDKYFENEDAKLFAIDINEETFQYIPKSHRWKGFCGDQNDKEFLTKVGKDHGPFDIIVEDGCHHPSYQKACFESLWPFVARGGVYIIEDVHHSYVDEYSKDISIEPYLQHMVKRMISAGKNRRKVDYDFIHYYRGVVVLGKKMRA